MKTLRSRELAVMIKQMYYISAYLNSPDVRDHALKHDDWDHWWDAQKSAERLLDRLLELTCSDVAVETEVMPCK